MWSMLALFPKCSVSQEEAQSHKAGTMCRNRNLWDSRTATRGQGPDTLPERKCCISQRRKHRDQNPCLLFLRVAYCRLGILKGAAQKCSARIKVCVKCSQLEASHFGKSGMADFMLYFQNPDELYGSFGYYLQKGNVWWGAVGKE